MLRQTGQREGTHRAGAQSLELQRSQQRARCRSASSLASGWAHTAAWVLAVLLITGGIWLWSIAWFEHENGPTAWYDKMDEVRRRAECPHAHHWCTGVRQWCSSPPAGLRP